MSSNFPTSLDSYTTKNAGDTISETHINDPQDAIEAIEAKVGIDNSADTTSLDYKVNNPSGIVRSHADRHQPGGADIISELLHVEDQKTSSTNGGDFLSGAWRTRDLNTVVTNEISGASLASNQITLPSGTYEAEWSAPAYNVNRHQTILYNVTSSATLLVGTSEVASSAGDQSRSFGFGRFTLSGTTVIELRHQCQTSRANGEGFGIGSGYSFTVDHETYSIVKIRKIA